MRRREFITLLGGAAAWPIAARAQQAAMPVIGVLGADSSDQYADRLRAFRQGLKESGYIEGQNLVIEYRWANGSNDKLPVLAADLVHLDVNAIVALGSTPAALAAKAATTTTPVVFFVGADPVRLGLVASLARPGGNLTGATTLNEELVAKRMELMHEAIPKTTSIALLVNPTSPGLAEAAINDAQAATRKLGLKLDVLHASTERELDTAFRVLTQLQAGALVIATDAFFISRSEQLGALALGHLVPAIFSYRPFVVAGGMMSYSTPIETYSLAGIYTGRILKGQKPADLPVQQVSKVELLINLKTAKALGITFPITLLGRADEVIE
jgi:putative tryptophan/tyrosine transport system substrate-binding protein